MSLSQKNIQYWDNVFKSHEWGKYPPVGLIRFIARNFYSVKNRNEIKILEIGSGPGANLWYMSREGFSVYGIDGSSTACEQALNRLSEDGLSSGGIKVGDYSELLEEFDDNYFDAVVDLESLYCNSFTQSKLILEKVFRKLKKNGLFFSMTFANNPWHNGDDEVEYHAHINKDSSNNVRGSYHRYTTKEDIQELYVVNGISELVKVEKQVFYPEVGSGVEEWLIEIKRI